MLLEQAPGRIGQHTPTTARLRTLGGNVYWARGDDLLPMTPEEFERYIEDSRVRGITYDPDGVRAVRAWFGSKERQILLADLDADPRKALEEFCHEGLGFDDVRSGLFSEEAVAQYPPGKPVQAFICSAEAFGATEEEALAALVEVVKENVRKGQHGC